MGESPSLSIIRIAMNRRLIVKNFGPLKNIDIELKDVTVFIGPQATGKSCLAKLVNIIISSWFKEKSDDEFYKHLTDSNINFVTNNTEIVYIVGGKVFFQLLNKALTGNNLTTDSLYFPAERMFF